MERLLAAFLAPPATAQRPIFIIGPPRSGSTLAFQIVVSAFDVGYFTNRHCWAFGAPALLGFRPARDKVGAETFFASYHGQTAGLDGPSECGAWWYRFFPSDPVYVSNSDVRPAAMAAFKRSVLLFAARVNRPLVFKNLYAGMRIEPMATQFPDAIFVHVTRDRFDNAQSILAARMAANETYDDWWSLPPPGKEALEKLPPEQQVVGQIAAINAQIAKDVERLALGGRVLNVAYERMCRDPNGFVEMLADIAAKGGITLSRVGTVPSSFPLGSKSELPDDLCDALKATLYKEDNP
jgi:LPS sulfotransferase NodH